MKKDVFDQLEGSGKNREPYIQRIILSRIIYATRVLGTGQGDPTIYLTQLRREWSNGARLFETKKELYNTVLVAKTVQKRNTVSARTKAIPIIRNFLDFPLGVPLWEGLAEVAKQYGEMLPSFELLGLTH